MSLQLKAGPTSLEKLETAIGRMVQKHGFFNFRQNFRPTVAFLNFRPA